MKCIVCDMCGEVIKHPRDGYVVRVYKPYLKKREVYTDTQRDPIKDDEVVGDRILCADICTTCYPEFQEMLSKAAADAE